MTNEEAWEWSADDHVFFSDQDGDSYEVGQVQGVSGATLTLKSALAGSYRGFCWPLLFGHFRCEDIGILTSHHGSLRIAVLERDVKPEANPDLCAIVLLVDGRGDSFDCYAVQDPVGSDWTRIRMGMLVAMEPDGINNLSGAQLRFIPHACVPQAGVDCVQLVVAIFWETYGIDDRQLPDYTMDGGEHRDRSQVLEWLDASPRFDRLAADAPVQPGDVVCFRLGRVPHHVGLVLAPPIFIHAMRQYGVIESRIDDPTFAKRLAAVYRPVQ